MDAKRLKKYQQRLYSRMPLIAERRWRKAAQALAQDSSPDAVQVLAEAVACHNDTRAQQVLVETLRKLVDQRCIDVVCAVWAATRHAGLAALLAEYGWVASAPIDVKVLSALLVGQWEEVTAGGKDVVAPLLQACADANPTIAGPARQALHNLQHNEVQETLCRIVLDSGQPTACEVAKAAQYAPQEPQQRALFYFLTEQWDKYETLDFDQTLLRAVYEVGEAKLWQRVAETARRAGRVAWIEVVTGGRHGQRLGAMTDGEWEATLAVLTAQKQGETMWRLAQVAPPGWSVRLLRELADMAWMPQAEQERMGFVEMRRLAAMLVGKTPELYRFVHSLSTLEGYTHSVHYLAMSPNGGVLASRGDDKTVRIWSVPEGEALRTLSGHTGSIYCLVISPDGQVLASGGDDKTVRIWSVPEGEALRTLSGHTDSIYCLVISPDGQVLASGGDDKTVRIWSVPEGEALRTLSGHTSEVTRLAISPDGRVLASGSGDGTVRLWSMPDGEALHTLTEPTGEVTRLAISPDGRVLASGSGDGTVRLWSMSDGKALHTLSGHTRWVSSLAISPDGRVLASGSGDGTVRLWSMSDGKALHTLSGHTRWVSSLAISPDGRVLASGSGDGTVRLWSMPDGKALHTLTEHPGDVYHVAISPDGRVLASGGAGGVGRRWSLEPFRLNDLPLGHTSIRLLASGGAGGAGRLWSLEPLRLSCLPLGHTSVEDMAWVQRTLQSGDLSQTERGWLEFLLAMMRWQRRFDVGVGEALQRMAGGEFDIELEG